MKKTVFLALAVLILLVLFFVIPSSKKSKSKENSTKEIVLFDSKLKEEIVSIRVFNATSFEVKKANGIFSIISLGLKSGEEELEDFFRRLAVFKAWPLKDESGKENSFKPVLELELKEGKKEFLSMGSAVSFGPPSFYIKTSKGFFVLKKEYMDYLTGLSKNSFRDHNLTNYESEDLKGFTLDDKDFYYQDKWYIKGLEPDKTDIRKTFFVFATITGMRIKDFTGSRDRKKYNLDKPQHQVTITLKNSKVIKISYSSKEEHYYAFKEGDSEIVEIFERDFEKIATLKKDFVKDLKSVNLK